MTTRIFQPKFSSGCEHVNVKMIAGTADQRYNTFRCLRCNELIFRANPYFEVPSA